MALRLVVLLAAALVSTAGLSVSAWSLSQGQTDQAIAFGWPALAVGILIALMTPAGRRRMSGG